MLHLHELRLMKTCPWAIQDEDLSLSLSQLVQTKRGIVTVAMEGLSLLGMTPFIYIEYCTVMEYGPKRWLSIWNLMDLATYFLQARISCTCTVSILISYP